MMRMYVREVNESKEVTWKDLGIGYTKVCHCGSTKIKSKGLCSQHYMAQWMDAVPGRREAHNARQREYVRPDGKPVRPLKEVVGYFQAHRRVRYAKGGPAREFTCVDCDQQAAQWSLNHEALEVLYDDVRGFQVPYSLNTDDYDSRCVPCHKRYDFGTNAA